MNTATNRYATNPGSDLHVAFISNGKLFHQTEQGEVKQIHSPYIQEVTDRLERNRAKNAWKQDTSFGISAGGRHKDFEGNDAPIIATSAQFDENNSLLYFLKDENIGGLFSYDLTSKTEKRLLHKQNLDLGDLSLDTGSGKILCSSYAKNGVANIAMMNSDGNQFRELTGGDTFDSAPVWLSVKDKEIFYQSAGLARNAQGYIVAQGNASIQLLDMKTGNITPVKEDAQYDFLLPRVCPKGNLHFIRRPYEAPKYSTDNFLLDTLFFPFRLIRAIFHYLNFFSLMYSRKPLTSASGPAIQADIKDIILKGKKIDAEKALRMESKIHGVPSLVPKSWQLIRRTPQGKEDVLASNVASYAITSAGDIVYSNGRGVFLLGDANDSRLILKSELVGDVIAQVSAPTSASVSSSSTTTITDHT